MKPPELDNVRIFQSLGRVDTKALARCDQLLLILPTKATAQTLQAAATGRQITARFTALQLLYRRRILVQITEQEPDICRWRHHFAVGNSLRTANARPPTRHGD